MGVDNALTRRPLGRTGLLVSAISLGTVQLGMPYGIPDARGHLPYLSEAEALAILDRAVTEGINFMDTARDYGDSEALIGRALRRRNDEVILATKLTALDERMTDDEMARYVGDSIEAPGHWRVNPGHSTGPQRNAKLLKRDVLLDALATARQKERIRFQGVTTYGLDAPAAAVAQGYWDTIQAEFNVFNPALAELFVDIEAKKMGLIIRSAMLKGVMTTDEADLPEPLRPLRQKALDLPAMLGQRTLTVPQAALLFVLSHPAVSTVLTGVLSVNQLLENLAVGNLPPLSEAALAEAASLRVADSQLTDPRAWPLN